jgi:hypothetical protein
MQWRIWQVCIGRGETASRGDKNHGWMEAMVFEYIVNFIKSSIEWARNDGTNHAIPVVEGAGSTTGFPVLQGKGDGISSNFLFIILNGN